MNDETVIQIAAHPDSAKDGILMDALDDADYCTTAAVLRSFKNEANVNQLEYWRTRLCGDREIWTPGTVEQYWIHIQSLRNSFSN